jgi:hypothetical protein
MRRLGYWHYTWDQDIARVWYKQDADISRMLRFAKSFESFDDVPWSRLEFVDAFAAAYPDAKYVLLERDMDEWHDSLVRFRQKRGIVARTSREEDIAEHLERIHYLSGKFSGEQMLRMNVFDGDGYDKLCPFLGLPVPADPFPRVNVNTTVRAR